MKTMTRSLVMIGIVTGLTLAAPALAQEEQGEVQEIIIKIQTPDGPRWYSLGTDLSKIDIEKGAVIRFNYEDDTIEAIEVEPGDPPAAKE